MSDYEQRLRTALINQHKQWFDYHTQALKPQYAETINCPVCGSDIHELAFEKDWFKFARCCECGMVYLNPRLNEEATYQFYNSEWNAIYNENKFDAVTTTTQLDNAINENNLRLIESLVDNPGNTKGRLLEVGIGSGHFIRKAVESGYDVYGVELNYNNCLKVKDILGDKIINADLYSAGFPSNMFDVIYLRDVFEHVPDPRKMVAEFNRIARPGCLLYIEVPNIEGLIYKIVKQKHVCIFGFEHLNYWSPQTLSKLLAMCGFEVTVLKHKSLDFTLCNIIAHFYQNNSTSVQFLEVSPIKRFLCKCFCKLLSLQPFASIDRRLTPLIADALKRGSVITTVARKVKEIEQLKE